MSMPVEMFGTQDLKDDDGEVIDSLFIETDAPPDIKQATQPILVKELIEPRKITRLLSGDITIDPSWTVSMLLPADANRQELKIRVYSPTSVATDGVRFSDDRGNILSSGKVLHGGTSPFENHTGPVYYIACGNAANGAASAPVSLEYWAVTE